MYKTASHHHSVGKAFQESMLSDEGQYSMAKEANIGNAVLGGVVGSGIGTSIGSKHMQDELKRRGYTESEIARAKETSFGSASHLNNAISMGSAAGMGALGYQAGKEFMGGSPKARIIGAALGAGLGGLASYKSRKNFIEDRIRANRQRKQEGNE